MKESQRQLDPYRTWGVVISGLMAVTLVLTTAGCGDGSKGAPQAAQASIAVPLQEVREQAERQRRHEDELQRDLERSRDEAKRMKVQTDALHDKVTALTTEKTHWQVIVVICVAGIFVSFLIGCALGSRARKNASTKNETTITS